MLRFRVLFRRGIFRGDERGFTLQEVLTVVDSASEIFAARATSLVVARRNAFSAKTRVAAPSICSRRARTTRSRTPSLHVSDTAQASF